MLSKISNTISIKSPHSNDLIDPHECNPIFKLQVLVFINGLKYLQLHNTLIGLKIFFIKLSNQIRQILKPSQWPSTIDIINCPNNSHLILLQ